MLILKLLKTMILNYTPLYNLINENLSICVQYYVFILIMKYIMKFIGHIYLSPIHSVRYNIYHNEGNFYYGHVSGLIGVVNLPNGYKWNGKEITISLWDKSKNYDSKKWSTTHITINNEIYEKYNILAPIATK